MRPSGINNCDGRVIYGPIPLTATMLQGAAGRLENTERCTHFLSIQSATLPARAHRVLGVKLCLLSESTAKNKFASKN
jgi:hypothetical protein